MNSKFYTLFIVLALLGTAASAQLKKADKLFKSYSYAQAIPEYLKMAKNGDGTDRNHAIVRLADCYRLTNDQLKARDWYAIAVKLPATDPINWFYYGQSLRCAEEYTMAKEAYEQYAKLVPADPRGKAYAGFCALTGKITAQPAAFDMKEAKSLNTKQSEFGPVFYADGMIYVSDRRQDFIENKVYSWTNFNYLSMLFSKPSSPGAFYGEMNAPESFAGKFKQGFHDGPATFARHDSLIYFTRTGRGHEKRDADDYRTDRLKIYSSAYNGRWSKVAPFFLNSDAYSVGHPSLSPDGKTLYFVSDMPGGFGGKDIWSCVWKDGKWDKPANLGENVNSFGDEMFPTIFGDKLYFASDGWPGLGGLDVFVSTLTKGSWSKPMNLGLPVNSSFDDFSMALDASGQNGFFSSNRPGGTGSDDIYACMRLEQKEIPAVPVAVLADTADVFGNVKDKQTLKPMAGTTVFLLNTKTNQVKVLSTDANGQYNAFVDKGVAYVAKGIAKNYVSDCIPVEIAVADTARRAVASRDLLLEQLEVNKEYDLENLQKDAANIYYDFAKWDIRPEAGVELNKLVQLMKEHPIHIEIGSYTDSRGSEEYNMFLSQKRAETVVSYMTGQGVDSLRIKAVGYGKTKLTNNCVEGVKCTKAQHQANRRTTFKITALSTQPATEVDAAAGKYKSGEVVPASAFGKDFFGKCLK